MVRVEVTGLWLLYLGQGDAVNSSTMQIIGVNLLGPPTSQVEAQFPTHGVPQYSESRFCCVPTRRAVAFLGRRPPVSGFRV